MTEEDGYSVYRVWVEMTQAGWLDVDATSPDEAKKFAVEAVYEGSKPEYEDGWATATRVFVKAATCKVEDAAAKTPWCSIHDSPMRPDNSPDCYDAWQHRAAAR